MAGEVCDLCKKPDERIKMSIPGSVRDRSPRQEMNPVLFHNSNELTFPQFLAALFTIARICKRPKYPLMSEWTDKMYIYTKYYYSAIKDEILSYVTAWMDFEGTMLREISQMEDKKHKILLLKFMDIENKLVVTREEVGCEESKLGKGGQLYGDRQKLDFWC